MLLVSINGIIQTPGIDYHATNKSIAFVVPPQVGTTIDIRGRNGTLASILGDGFSYLFEFFSDFEHDQSQMLEEAFKYRNIPAVADVLERLQVVVNLVKQDESIR
jgi:hypothetical protein